MLAVHVRIEGDGHRAGPQDSVGPRCGGAADVQGARASGRRNLQPGLRTRRALLFRVN